MFLRDGDVYHDYKVDERQGDGGCCFSGVRYGWSRSLCM